jgi:hypothetical protein
MLLLNFTHPLPLAQLDRLAEMAGRPIVDVREHMAQFDHERPFAEQVAALADAMGLSPEQWQTEAILVNPPALAPIATVLIAELHGRMGYFPAIVRVRPVAGSTPPVYEVAEIINLQAVRDAARQRRT